MSGRGCPKGLTSCDALANPLGREASPKDSASPLKHFPALKMDCL